MKNFTSFKVLISNVKDLENQQQFQIEKKMTRVSILLLFAFYAKVADLQVTSNKSIIRQRYEESQKIEDFSETVRELNRIKRRAYPQDDTTESIPITTPPPADLPCGEKRIKVIIKNFNVFF